MANPLRPYRLTVEELFRAIRINLGLENKLRVNPLILDNVSVHIILFDLVSDFGVLVNPLKYVCIGQLFFIAGVSSSLTLK